MPAGVGHAALVGLDDVGELVGDEPIAGRGAGLVFAGPEVQVGAEREGVGGEVAGVGLGGGIGVDAHVGEVVPEGALHALEGAGVERLSGAAGGGNRCGGRRPGLGAAERAEHGGVARPRALLGEAGVFEGEVGGEQPGERVGGACDCGLGGAVAEEVDGAWGGAVRVEDDAVGVRVSGVSGATEGRRGAAFGHRGSSR